MVRKLSPLVFLLLRLLSPSNVFSQNPENMIDNLSVRFLRYCKTVPREEIFIHTDREEFISGEDLWFNIYLIDRQSFKPSMLSRIAYFELLNTANKPVIQKRILTGNGFGPGQIKLPDTLSSGTYTIRAYTSWMKNFLPYNCFMKKIRVYNALNKVFNESLNSGRFFENGTAMQAGPGYETSGFTIKINNSAPDSLGIFVNAGDKIRSYNGNLFYIFIQTHGNINFAASETMSGESTKINIPKRLLSSGINQITIFSSRGVPVSERYIYTPVKKGTLVELSSEDSCKIRYKTAIEIRIGNPLQAEPISGNLSISVAPKTNQKEFMDIDQYLVFGTEYGLLNCDAIKGKNIYNLPPGVIDSILLNAGSNWINWKTVLSGDAGKFKYQIEDRNYFLPGKLVTNENNVKHDSELILLCTPGKEAGFQYARTDRNGDFFFKIHIDETLKDLIIVPDGALNNRNILIETSFSDQYLQSENSSGSMIRPVPSYISKWSVNYQVKRIYKKSALGNPLNPVSQPLKPVRFYGKPDIELVLADYLKLPTMEEVFFELLPHVSLRKNETRYEISIDDRINDRQYFLKPTLWIDGVVIKDPSLIVNLDPEIVERIDVIKEKYLVGKYIFPGIVNVITKSGEFNCIPLPGNMIRLPFRVADPVPSFISPDYSSSENKGSRIPDYRNTLYWNPSVRSGKDGKVKIKFWTSDNAGEYEINIQGLTDDGRFISAKRTLEVY